MRLFDLVAPVFRPVARPFSKRFVAGETREDVVQYARTLDENNITPMIDLLGEHLESRENVEAAMDEYRGLLHRLDADGVDANLSVKPTHLGLKLGEHYVRNNVAQLLQAGDDRFVWLDMESSAHTDETIQLYASLREEFDNVGICIQAYLKRSADDIATLLDEDAIIRLVKGAYSEPNGIAWRKKADVDENYRLLLKELFHHDNYFAVATHDRELVDYARELEHRYGHDLGGYEFQFLMGVRDDLKQELVDAGYTVSEYVPYGPEWLAYYWRRVRERRENLFFAIRALVGQ